MCVLWWGAPDGPGAQDIQGAPCFAVPILKQRMSDVARPGMQNYGPSTTCCAAQQTLEFHWGKHHRSYVTNLNNQIKDKPLANKTLEEVGNRRLGPSFVPVRLLSACQLNVPTKNVVSAQSQGLRPSAVWAV